MRTPPSTNRRAKSSANSSASAGSGSWHAPSWRRPLSQQGPAAARGQAGAELRSDPKDDEVALTYDDPPGVEFWADEGDAVVRYALRWSPDDPVWGWSLESRGED